MTFAYTVTNNTFVLYKYFIFRQYKSIEKPINQKNRVNKFVYSSFSDEVFWLNIKYLYKIKVLGTIPILYVYNLKCEIRGRNIQNFPKRIIKITLQIFTRVIRTRKVNKIGE